MSVQKGGVQLSTSTSEEPPAPDQPRSVFRRIQEVHRQRSWGGLFAFYSGIITIGIAAIGLFISCQANSIAQEDSQSRAELELAKVTAGLKGIPGEITGFGKEEKIEVDAAHIAVTVRNLENAPSFISKATLVFSEGGRLYHCYPEDGAIQFTGHYTFKIPQSQIIKGSNWNAEWIYRVPFNLSAEVTYKVPPNDYQKFLLSVGPETSTAADAPWYAVMDVVLEHDDGKTLRFGPIAVIGPGDEMTPEGDEWYIGSYASPTYRECMKRNAALVSELVNTPSVVASTELTSLDRTLDKYR